MATITITINPAIDGRVIAALARYFGWPKGEPAPYQGKTRKEYVSAALQTYLISLVRSHEVKDSVDDAADAAKVSAEAAAAALDLTVG